MNIEKYIHQAIKVIYPNINGGYTYYPEKNNWEDALFWENQQPKPTQEEIEIIIPSVELENEKKLKISQLNKNRDEYLLRDHTSHQAIELIDDEGDFIEGEEVFFAFRCKSTNNPATEPNTILLEASQDQMGFIRYSCEIIEGQNRRKGYIKLDHQTAISLKSHLKVRNENTIYLANLKEIEINNASTIEELESININFI